MSNSLFHRITLVSRITFAVAILLLSVAPGLGKDPAPLPATMPWDVKALGQAPTMTWVDQDGPVRALMYQGEPYQGHPTQVFAYYASPITVGTVGAEEHFPGIVLVHGGGGKAFSQWAEIWARRGYAAIAMDLAGCGAEGKPLPNGGPDQSDQTKFRAIDGPIKDQWSYHAVADVLLAHSLLLSFEEVDAQRTAVTGISWGGYLTCIVAGVDQRFKVAMPVYGCGFLHDNSCWLASQFQQMQPAQVAKWVSLWDPSSYIGAATMPVAFLNGTNDFAYPMDSYAKTCQLVTGTKQYSIQLKMPHGHIFEFPEFFVFIDQYLKGGTPMPVVARPQVSEGKLQAHVTSSTELVSARLHFTAGPHADNPKRPWVTQALQIDNETITGQAPPEHATAWYVDVTDQRKVVASSEVVITDQH